MNLRVVLFLLVLIATAIFAAVNWAAFTAPMTLSLLVTTVEAPLGLIMLGLTGLITLMCVVTVVFLRTSVLVEARRHTRELQAQRELADKAETSRFTELRTLLEARVLELREQAGQGQAEMLARLEQLDRDLRAAVEQAGNSLAAYIGELDNRLDRQVAEESPRHSS